MLNHKKNKILLKKLISIVEKEISIEKKFFFIDNDNHNY